MVLRLDRDRARRPVVGAHVRQFGRAAADRVAPALLVDLDGEHAGRPGARARRGARRACTRRARAPAPPSAASAAAAASSAGTREPGLQRRQPLLEPVVAHVLEPLHVHQPVPHLDRVAVLGRQQVQLVALLHALRLERGQPLVGRAEVVAEGAPLPAGNDFGHVAVHCRVARVSGEPERGLRHLAAGEGRKLLLLGDVRTIKAGGEDTGRELTVVEQVAAPGASRVAAPPSLPGGLLRPRRRARVHRARERGACRRSRSVPAARCMPLPASPTATATPAPAPLASSRSCSPPAPRASSTRPASGSTSRDARRRTLPAPSPEAVLEAAARHGIEFLPGP